VIGARTASSDRPRNRASARTWAALVALACALGAAACRERATSVEREAPVAAVGAETGARDAAAPPLAPLRRIAGEPETPLRLADRMARLGVSALSVATLEGGGVRAPWTAGTNAAGAAVTPRTLFPGGAITDPLAAAILDVAVLRWAAENGVGLESSIGDRVPSPALTRRAGVPAPTLAQLLGHSAGLPDTEPDGRLPPAERLRSLAAPGGTLPLVDRPGRRFRYSPAGVLLLRQLLLAEGGVTLQQRLAHLLLDPAGLGSTFVETSPGELPADSATIPESGEGAPASDLWTTPTDVARLIAALAVSARGVEPDTLLPWTLARRALSAGPGGFGWGFRIVEPGPRFELEVEGEGYAVLAVGFADTQDGLVVMAAGGRGAGENARGGWLAREILAGWAQARGLAGFEPEIVEPVPAAPVARAVEGRYRFAEGDLVVRVQDGRLVVEAEPGVLGAGAVREPVYPRGSLRFLFLDRPEVLSFVAGEGSAVRGVLVGERRGLRAPESPAR
jgi:CubicO group peptidase (beta-lactamase class C family)